jgi:phosphatidate cytidylyltransferase
MSFGPSLTPITSSARCWSSRAGIAGSEAFLNPRSQPTEADPPLEVAGGLGATPVAPRVVSRSELLPRVVTAAIAGPIVFVCSYAGGIWIVAVVLAATAMAVWEVTALSPTARAPIYRICGVLAAWASPLATATGMVAVGWLMLGASAIAGLLRVAARTRDSSALGAWALSVSIGVYVGALLASSIGLRNGPDGQMWFTLVILSTWACDIMAYFVGRAVGRHKLAPAVSPGKSIEGLIGGVVGAVGVAAIGAFLVSQPPIRVLGLGVVVAIGAVLGDLAESAVKRQLGAKDFGRVLPGHGGILDRVDSLLFASLLGYAYVTLTEWVMGQSL